ncbi:MAG TPA: hypothetical protein VJY66_01605 [Acholeplasma sp.]|nr:hypothetical protein [Acholeplasma sp.]
MFKKLIIKVGSLLMDPVKKVGNTKFSEKFVNFSNKNPWIKVLLSFFITAAIIYVVYYMKETTLF